MSLATTDSKVTYQGNGATTTWPFSYPVLEKAHLKVILTDPAGAENTLTNDYVVDLTGKIVTYPGYENGQEPSVVDQPPKLPTGWKITLLRQVPLTQETDLGDRWPFKEIEDMSDRTTMQIQQLAEAVDRSLKVPVSGGSSGDLITDILGTANGYATAAAGSASSAAGSATTASASATAAGMSAAAAAARVTEAEAAAALAEAASNTTGSKSTGAYVCGVKTHQCVLPVRSGATEIPVARFALNGIGWAAGAVKASTKMRVTVKAGETMSTSEFGIYRNGSSYRVDFQGALSGGAGALDYYALSRGSSVLPKGVVTSLGTSPGYLGWKNNASAASAGSHNHMNGSLTWEGIPYSGMTDYQLGSPNAHHHTITELATDGAHTHTVAIEAAFKINGAAEGNNTSAANSAVDNHAELGVTSAPKFWPTIYGSGGAVFGNHYTPQTTDYLEMRVGWMDSSAANAVEVIIEFLGLNHTLWFYDGEKQAWGSSPGAFALGDSIVESVDLGGAVPTPSSGVYGSSYRFIWTDLLGIKNYGTGGHKTDEILARTNLSGSTLYIDGAAISANTGIVNGGINDCIQKVLYNHSKKFSTASYESGWTFSPLNNIKTLISRISAAGIKPYLLLSPAINAAVYAAQSTLQISNFDGSSVESMPAAYWDEIAELWEKTKAQLQVWARINQIELIDWYTPMEVENFNASLSHDGIHLSFLGYNVAANLVYDAVYRHVSGSSYLNVSTSSIIINAEGIQRPTVAVGSVVSGAEAAVTNVGTSSDAVFNFVLPKGADGTDGTDGTAATIAVGSVTSGGTASVLNVGTANSAVFDFVLPKGADGTNGADGADGTAATITVGEVTTGEPGTSVSVTNSGTTNAAVLNFVIPKGATGDAGTLATSTTAGVIKLAGDLAAGTAEAPELKESGVTPATYSGRLSVAVNAKGLVTGITKLPEKPTTLNIPGGSGYSSSAELCDTARKLNSVRINTRNQDYSSFIPGASTTIIIYKIVNGTTTAIATISGITVADTTYSLTTPADIEAGASVRAAFSGSNNSIPFADVICVWGVAA